MKRRRNQENVELQNAISEEDNSRHFIGKTVEVLVEGPSKNAEKRGETDATSGPVQLGGARRVTVSVVFPGNRDLAGTLVDVQVLDARKLRSWARNRHPRIPARVWGLLPILA